VRTLLLAAGLGQRLRPLTNITPKCLVSIGGKPLLEIWLERLTEAGMGPFLINTHHLHKEVEDYVSSCPFKSQITLVYENKLLGTAGTLINNLEFFQNEDGMLIHADNYCLADLKVFKDAHYRRPKGCLLTMLTFRTDEPSSCGIVELDEQDVVINFYEKVINPPSNLANGAIYILSADFLKKLKMNFDNVEDFSTQIIENFLGQIYSHETKEVFLDIGTPKRYAKAQYFS